MASDECREDPRSLECRVAKIEQVQAEHEDGCAEKWAENSRELGKVLRMVRYVAKAQKAQQTEQAAIVTQQGALAKQYHDLDKRLTRTDAKLALLITTLGTLAGALGNLLAGLIK